LRRRGGRAFAAALEASRYADRCMRMRDAELAARGLSRDAVVRKLGDML
jgi:hypothetical protein